MATGIPYIPVDTNLPMHPKSLKMEAVSGVSRAWSWAVEVWLWCGWNRPSGDLSGLPTGYFDRPMRWPTRRVTLLDSMRQSGLIDGDQLHGWDERVGVFLHKREVNRVRQARYRATDDSVTSRVTNATRNAAVTDLEDRREEDRREDPSSAKAEVEQPLPGTQTPPKAKPTKAPKTVKPKRPTEIQALADRWKAMWCKITGTPEAEFHWADGLFLRFQTAVTARTVDIVVKATRGNAKEPKLRGQPALTWLADFWLDNGLQLARGAQTASIYQVEQMAPPDLSMSAADIAAAPAGFAMLRATIGLPPKGTPSDEPIPAEAIAARRAKLAADVAAMTNGVTAGE